MLNSILAAERFQDFELAQLFREFLKVTVFSPSLFRHYKNDPKGIEFDQQEEPAAKKVKKSECEKPVKPIAEISVKLWEKEDIYSDPNRALLLCEALNQSYGRKVMAFPYLKILEGAGFDLKAIPDPKLLTSAHCRLLKFFVKFVDEERLHLKGMQVERSANGLFIKSQMHALLVAEEIHPIELEAVALAVAALDPSILQTLNTLLWKKWVKGELISVMSKMCDFFNKTQTSRRIFGQIFNIDLRVRTEKRLDELFEEPFRKLTADWLPSARMADLQFLTKTAENISKDPRAADNTTEASKERILINLISMYFELFLHKFLHHSSNNTDVFKIMITFLFVF